MVNIDRIKEIYPLHWLVWNNNYTELDKVLSTNEVNIINYYNINYYYLSSKFYYYGMYKKIFIFTSNNLLHVEILKF